MATPHEIQGPLIRRCLPDPTRSTPCGYRRVIALPRNNSGVYRRSSVGDAQAPSHLTVERIETPRIDHGEDNHRERSRIAGYDDEVTRRRSGDVAVARGAIASLGWRRARRGREPHLLFDRVTKRAVSGPPLRRHPGQDRHRCINIIDDKDIGLSGVSPVQSSHILSQRPLPGNRHRQEERIEARVIKPLPDAASCRHDEALRLLRHGQCRVRLLPLGRRLATVQDRDILDESGKAFLQIEKVIFAFGQDDRRSPAFESLEDVVEDEVVACVIPRERGIDLRHRRAFRRGYGDGQLEARRPISNPMTNAALGGLSAGVELMADRTALHEDDRVMPVLTGDRRGQPQNEPRFGPPGDKLEAGG